MPKYPGCPPYDLPFEVEARGARAIAHLKSGDELDLTGLIPRLAGQARTSAYPRKSVAAGLRALQRGGVQISGGEWEALVQSALRLVAELDQEEREYVDDQEAARILGLPLSAVRRALDSEEGRRMLGHPLVVGDEVRIPRAALDPRTRAEYLDSL